MYTYIILVYIYQPVHSQILIWHNITKSIAVHDPFYCYLHPLPLLLSKSPLQLTLRL